jgi:hypothetical protein
MAKQDGGDIVGWRDFSVDFREDILSGSVNFRRKQDPLIDARTRACRMHGQSWAACSKCLTPLGRRPLAFGCRGSWRIANEDC